MQSILDSAKADGNRGLKAEERQEWDSHFDADEVLSEEAATLRSVKSRQDKLTVLAAERAELAKPAGRKTDHNAVGNEGAGSSNADSRSAAMSKFILDGAGAMTPTEIRALQAKEGVTSVVNS